jgi:glycine C-acetyltransferase
MRREGVCFYEESTADYLPSCRVFVDGHGEMLMFGSYSYLSLNHHPAINAAAHAAIDHYGTGTLGVRLLAGTLDLHHRLEERIARFKQAEAAVTFSSGYLANVAAIGCLVGHGDTVICDKFDHASIFDGCQLSRARLVRYDHNDMDQLESRLRDASGRGRTLVVADAVFSMDGDVLNLPDVSQLCRRYGAQLLVDEAHSLGVLGATGHGIEEHFSLPGDAIDFKMGTFSKAIGNRATANRADPSRHIGLVSLERPAMK